jgi:1,2-phenylacetyl-CoA epoxidase catalytic subunit
VWSKIPTSSAKKKANVDFGTNAAAEFAAKGGEHKERIQKAVDYWYVKGLDMFGNSKSYRSERYMHWGTQTPSKLSGAPAVQRRIDALILKMGLTLPDPNKGRLYT